MNISVNLTANVLIFIFRYFQLLKKYLIGKLKIILLNSQKCEMSYFQLTKRL